MDYVGYGRVSRIGDRKDKLQSFKFQERDIRAAAAQRDLGLCDEIITDPDESGANPERKGLMRAIEMVESGQADGIIVARLDRFSRDVSQALALAGRIHAAGGKIISFAENPDWVTPEGELQVGLAFQIAQYERSVKRQYLDRSKGAAVERGIPVQPRMVPGLLIVLDDAGNRKTVAIDEPVAEIMREFFRRRAAGAGPSALADLLEANRVETSMGSTSWSKEAIYGLIRNRAYLGELRNGEYVKENAWPAIIDIDTFNAAQKPIVKVPSTRAKGDHPDLLMGLARCANCRYCLNITNTSRGKRMYRCQGRHAAGRCPSSARAYAADLEPVVLTAFWDMVRDHHARGASVVDRTHLNELRVAAAKAERALTLYRDDPDLEETVAAMGGMGAWRDGLAVRNRRREEARQEVARELAAVERQDTIDLPPLTALRRDWEAMSHGDRRDMLGRLIDTIALLPISSGLPLSDRVVIFAAGHGPTDLPRRGFHHRPTIRPFDLPAGPGGA